MKQKTWYYRPTAGHETHGQGVVVDEATGRDVAVIYDGDADGAMLAAAPEMLAALELVLNCQNYTSDGCPVSYELQAALTEARLAASKARGGQ